VDLADVRSKYHTAVRAGTKGGRASSAKHR
jgi:hypothetical protein